MSRIHEALLQAQRERGIAERTLDLNKVQLTGEMNRPLTGSSTDFLPSVPEDDSVEPSNQLRFGNVNWQPDKYQLVFLSAESARIGLSPVIESFRTLRSKLLRARGNKLLKTILITGAVPGEGKTFVAGNLAMAMAADSENRVLLIDADLRKPRLQAMLGVEATSGLSSYLNGSADAASIVGQTPQPQLCVITAGRHEDISTELLHTERMRTLLEEMREHFDWIFIDSPPAAAVADSSLLVDFCDGVLLVIAPGTHVNDALRSKREIGQKILGVVLNKSDYGEGYYSYYASLGKNHNLSAAQTVPSKHGGAGFPTT